jgi:CRP-like cAMP-binding protein
MEKKGEILNQLAIISDLFEKANMKSLSTSVICELEEIEFKSVFEKFSARIRTTPMYPHEVRNTFSVKIGEIDFVFNKSNA